MRTSQSTLARCGPRVSQRPLTLALALALGLGSPLAGLAATISVTATDDAGTATSCALRQAIVSMDTGSVSGTGCVNSGAAFGTSDTINFDAATFPNGAANTITLADANSNTSTLAITDANLTIDATANGNVTIQRPTGAAYTFGIINDSAAAGGSLTLNHLTLSNGKVTSSICNNRQAGGGICILAANLNLSNSTLSGNSASLGGAITSFGSVTLTNSTLSDNLALFGGGIYTYAGAGSVTLTNSTLSGNSAAIKGGGIYSRSSSVTLINSTLSGNSAPDNKGGGIYSNNAVTATNSIVAGNTGGDIQGSVASISSGNIIGVDPKLDALADNGGPTWTMLPQSGSPVIDAIACTNAPATDQRGVPRPQGVQCDIGAVETDRIFANGFEP